MNRRPAVVVLLLVIVGLIGTGGWLGWSVRENHVLNNAAKDASEAGRQTVTAVLSYDYQTLDADLARAERGLTPGFKDDYAKVVATSVKPVAARDKVVTTANVPAVSVTGASAERVRLLMFVDQLTSSAKEKNVVNVSRVEVTMTRGETGWLVSDLRAV